MSSFIEGRILSREGWVLGRLHFDAQIQRIEPRPEADPTRRVLPGFIDLHVHGGMGVDIMEGGEAARTVARAHARHGTTAMLGTTMTAPDADIRHALVGLAGVCAERRAGEARLLGVHLEGPFLSPGKLGAQPGQVCAATMALLREYLAIAPIRVVTIAPEVARHLDIISELAQLGVRPQVGHTLGSYEDGVAALRAGAAGFTHLFNAMRGLNHYEPGMVGAALAHARHAELIPDLLHVHPGAIRAALRAIPELYCVTDATAATDMPDGNYPLGSQMVCKCLGGVRLPDGGLAGSALTMDQALRNLLSLGLDLADASHRLSRNPARYLGLVDRGEIRIGAVADLVCLDEDMQVREVVIEGERLSV